MSYLSTFHLVFFLSSHLNVYSFFFAIATISPSSLIEIPEGSAHGPIKVGQKSEPAYYHNIEIEAQAPWGKPLVL
jgi:hypothetical protein